MPKLEIHRIGQHLWEIPARAKQGMNVPARIYTSAEMLPDIDDAALDQVSNAAMLPGVVLNTLAMPDIHSGYGLPIGGVMATDPAIGVVSPGAAGYDINCGVRLMKTPFVKEQIMPLREMLADLMAARIPCGVGRAGLIDLSDADYRAIAERGAAWAVHRGFGLNDDITHTESGGALEGGSLEGVSGHARKRGRDEMGTLGGGNHFVEIQYVDQIYDPGIAAAWGLREGQITLMIHTGSRGFGHQVATDHLKSMEHAMRKYGISVPDRELACVPVDSGEGREYLSAMRAAANYAWTNRQVIMHLAREVLSVATGAAPDSMPLLYDVAHNIIKLEEHTVDGEKRKVMVHRKGATRALGAGHPELPEAYKNTGQPVLIPGDMGRMSYLLAGTQTAMEQTFGSSCHGAGRALSRHAAAKKARGRNLRNEMANQGVAVRSAEKGTLAEEMPEAYKDVSQVVDVVTAAGLALPVARLRPIAVIKG